MAHKEVQKGSLILVHFVERQLEGWEFQRGHWPLHITLVPWFKVNDEEAVKRSLEHLARDLRPQRLKVGKVEMFGTKKNVPVNVISNQRPVQALHKLLVATLEEVDTVYHDIRWLEQQFIAHVTRHQKDKRQAEQGERIIMDRFHLVRLIDKAHCRVEQEFQLKQEV